MDALHHSPDRRRLQLSGQPGREVVGHDLTRLEASHDAPQDDPSHNRHAQDLLRAPAFAIPTADLYNRVPCQHRAKHAGQCGGKVEGGR